VVKRWHEPISSPKRHCRSRSATETILRAHFALFDIAASFVFPCKGLRALNNLIPRSLGSEIGPRKRHPNGCTIALLKPTTSRVVAGKEARDERAFAVARGETRTEEEGVKRPQ
jgi:hypothetical protein